MIERTPRLRAFTLIEMLVSLSILAVLLLILLPTLAKARKQAQMSKCLSNLRQISTIALTVSTDDPRDVTLKSMTSIVGASK